MKTLKTILDQDRTDLAKLFKGAGVEVGVAQGRFAGHILGTNPGVTMLYGVDPYKPLRDYRDYTKISTFQKLKDDAYERVKPFGNRHEFLHTISMEAVKQFNDDYLDFVYIDGNHDYDHVTEDITEWLKKLKPGGIMSGDDYAKLKGRGDDYMVIEAVNDYVSKNQIPELFIYKARKHPSSWMFYKP